MAPPCDYFYCSSHFLGPFSLFQPAHPSAANAAWKTRYFRLVIILDCAQVCRANLTYYCPKLALKISIIWRICVLGDFCSDIFFIHANNSFSGTYYYYTKEGVLSCVWKQFLFIFCSSLKPVESNFVTSPHVLQRSPFNYDHYSISHIIGR